MQLFLLPFAGGGFYSFEFLKVELRNSGIDIHSLELPGRGKRLNSDFVSNKTDAIADYVAQINELRNSEPYIIYGHSMGATLGLSVAHKMEESNDPPVQIIVTGNAGPCIVEKDDNGDEIVVDRYLLSDIDFKNELRKLNGISEQVLENKELFDFFSPILRSDFEILEKQRHYEKEIKINTPIHAIMGDKEKTSIEIDNWKNYTKNDFTSEVFSGDHFFIYQHVDKLVNIIMHYSQPFLQKHNHSDN
jgi:external thioesterase TEII